DRHEFGAGVGWVPWTVDRRRALDPAADCRNIAVEPITGTLGREHVSVATDVGDVRLIDEEAPLGRIDVAGPFFDQADDRIVGLLGRSDLVEGAEHGDPEAPGVVLDGVHAEVAPTAVAHRVGVAVPGRAEVVADAAPA